MNKYIFFGYSDYSKIVLNDIINLENVCYYEFKSHNVIENFIYKFCTEKFYKRIFSRLPMLITKHLFVYFYDRKFINENCTPVFVFYEISPMARNKQFIEYLRKKYPSMKSVFIILNTLPDKQEWSVAQVNEIKKEYDKVITFDEVDAQNYDLFYYDQIFSKIEINDNGNEKSDLYFCGQNGSRIDTLQQIYERLNSYNIKCNFSVYGGKQNGIISDESPGELRIEKNKDISVFYDWKDYSQVLEEVNQSNCLLEILRDTKHSGSTLRTVEAIVFKKKLLTNNIGLINKKYFNPRQMSVFKSPEDIDIDFLRKQIDVSQYNLPESISPVLFLDYLSLILENKVQESIA